MMSCETIVFQFHSFSLILSHALGKNIPFPQKKQLINTFLSLSQVSQPLNCYYAPSRRIDVSSTEVLDAQCSLMNCDLIELITMHTRAGNV